MKKFNTYFFLFWFLFAQNITTDKFQVSSSIPPIASTSFSIHTFEACEKAYYHCTSKYNDLYQNCAKLLVLFYDLRDKCNN